MQQPSFQRPKAPLDTPVAGATGLSHEEWSLFHETTGDVSAFGPTLHDTHANRINNVVSTQTPPYYGRGRFLRYLYHESDTGAMYLCELVANIPTWIWVGGVAVVFGPASLPAGLGTNDAGYLAFETTFFHAYRWNGANWTFAPGDSGAGYVVASPTSAAPFGGLWQLCDGSTVSVSKGDGTTTNVATPNLTGNTFIFGAAALTGVNVASQPTWDAAAVTEADNGVPTVVQSGTGATVAPEPHTHNLTNANAKLKPPSAANGGLPQNIGLVFYMRR
jgi:hypothetical protein